MFRRERLFEKGDLKYVFLDLLRERPRHGYDLIRALEERFEGRYTTSPGTVYPILQMLEDMGYVTVQSADGRKVYTVTDTGQRFLDDKEAQVKEIWSRARGQCGMGGNWGELIEAWRDIAYLLGRHRRLTANQTERIRTILAQARRDIAAALDEE